MAHPLSLRRSISPPPTRKAVHAAQKPLSLPDEQISDTLEGENIQSSGAQGPSLAAIEAGEATVRDHLAYFATHLQAVCRSPSTDSPRIPIDRWKQLYQRNEQSRGRHFVVHQHDHPVSGVHYDLRLQFSDSSSISFAIPYGLPGNPNSQRPMRMAIETRVHCLWNHLIESASHATGSLLIWDTGEYEVLQPSASKSGPETDEETDASDASDAAEQNDKPSQLSDSDKLVSAFRRRHLRIRLHGTRLPDGYTLSLRLPSANDTSGEQLKRPRYKRRRRTKQIATAMTDPETTDEETVDSSVDGLAGQKRKILHGVAREAKGEVDEGNNAALASGEEDEDEIIRLNNAYPGSNNTIGSIHQRAWFLSLDKQNSGFTKSATTGRWTRAMPSTRRVEQELRGWEAFYVKGREFERSVVTGRLAAEVMADEGVIMYKGRKMWRPIME